MFKHLLIAIDGSDLAEKAMRQGLELARAISARVTILNVTMPWSSIAVGEVAIMFPPKDFEANVAEQARKLIERATATAAEFGITPEGVYVSDAQPHNAILETATARGADLIVMGSHGRRGIAGLLIGSETHKTLTHGTIPVLVYRE